MVVGNATDFLVTRVAAAITTDTIIESSRRLYFKRKGVIRCQLRLPLYWYDIQIKPRSGEVKQYRVIKTMISYHRLHPLDYVYNVRACVPYVGIKGGGK